MIHLRLWPAAGGSGTSPSAGSTVDAMKQSASEVAGEMKKSAGQAMESAKAGAVDAQKAAAEKMAVLNTEAQKLFEEAMASIKEKKWDLADSTIKKLVDLKAKLPAEWQTKIENLRKSFTAA